ncbi:hypothetical protein KUTeg_000688 [Tegillarca granosa]|uniref:Uncharacterized protein n=1 Tax=Tegillarca granosa TaxID=220873 RepID=A0ABQ9FZB4_TEGGR|nr:hypothetical protein KUTeg_000688 [Tegillarca granosa]
MAGFGSAPTLVKVFFILLIVGILFHIVGFATPYWSDDDYYSHNGLWRSCYYRHVYHGQQCFKTNFSASWFEATQAFQVIGLVAAFIGLILVILFIFVTQTSNNRTVYIIGMVAVLVAAGCTILSIIIFGSKVSALSWSFALAVIGGILYGVAGLLMLINMLKR